MHVDVETEATPEGAGRIRRALEVLQYHMPARALATLHLLVSELVANGPRHARGGNAIRVSVNHSTSRVRVEVHDLRGQPSGVDPGRTSGQLGPRSPRRNV
jgi:two-component sensor histidine kinase